MRQKNDKEFVRKCIWKSGKVKQYKNIESIGNTLNVCLFEGEIGWIENFGEKMGLCVIWLGGEEK